MNPSGLFYFDRWAHWGHFQKKPWGFFHKFTQNAPKIYLSHSLRVLSKNALQYVHNVLSQIPTEFIVNFWWNWTTLRVFFENIEINPVGTLWTNFGAFFERTLNEWLGYILGAFWANLWKKPQGFFENVLNMPTNQNKINLMGKFWMCLAGILLGFF